MLESILIRNTATYDAVGARFENLKKVNFIYGANGCGKTTFSKLIYDPTNEAYSNCELVWKGNFTVDALVYNKDFRERNFGKGKMDGVFTLGEATKDEIDKIYQMQSALSVIKTKGLEKKATLDKQEQIKSEEGSQFKEAVWLDIYKENERDFKEAFRGYIKKEAFRDKVIEEFQSNTEPLQSIEDLRDKATTILGDIPQTLSLLSVVEFTALSEIETAGVWKKKIIGKADVPIAPLIQKLNLNDWVNEGRLFIVDDTCPFCQQKTITENFITQLEDYFDESFISSVTEAKELSQQYERRSRTLKHLLEEIEAREKQNEDTKLDVESFSSSLKTFISQLSTNTALLNAKIKEPSRTIELVSTKGQSEVLASLITSCNVELKKHNDIVLDYTNQRNKLIKAIWKYLVEIHRGMIDAFITKQTGLEKGIVSLREQHKLLQESYSGLNKQIKQANKNVTSVQPSVDEINRLLKSYGFFNFEIVPSKTEPNQYQIERGDGTIAESTLSEGEATFITFLYYLQLAKGSTKEDSITDDRVLIVDDPISSLDSNVLFVISSLIKEIIKDIKLNKGSIKQLILLTHNVYFHKEVSFVDGRTPKNGNTNYWIIRKNNNISTAEPYDMENPIQSSYELLWKELRISSNSGITVQNVMRRIIENYFKILGKYADDDLILSFENHQEKEICRSLVCWINDGSHGMPDDLYIEQLDSLIERYSEVFRQIFIKMGHAEHYRMMMRTDDEGSQVQMQIA